MKITRHKSVKINGKTYSSIKEASDTLHLSWNKTQRYFSQNDSYIGDLEDLKPSAERLKKAEINIKPTSVGGSYKIGDIDFTREHTLEECAEILYKLGLTTHITNRTNIKQIEERAIEKLRKKLEYIFNKDEIKQFLVDNYK